MVDWITISQGAGTGNATINVSASSYSELLERSTSLVISGGGKTATVNLIQRFDPSFSLNPSVINDIDWDSTTESDYRSVTVTSDVPWHITSKPNWVTVSEMSGSSSATITILAADNTGFTRTGTVVFENDNGLFRTLSLEQADTVDYSTYLTFHIEEDGLIYWGSEWQHDYHNTYTGDSQSRQIYYSINNGPWNSLFNYPSQKSFSVSSGDTVRFYGENTEYGFGGDRFFNNGFWTDIELSIEGNIMSLLSSDFANLRTIGDYTFADMFREMPKLTSARNLLLPATTIGEGCYKSLFLECTGLTEAPRILPAMTLAKECYTGMFYRCRNLTTVPELPATTLAEDCYGSMFRACNSLVAPLSELPATTLVKTCYNAMFMNCTNLTTAPVICATTVASACCQEMFASCSALTTPPPILPATTLAEECYESMFYECTGLTYAPILPAANLEPECYRSMFERCFSLNYIKCLALNPSSNSLLYWTSDVRERNGTFVKDANARIWANVDTGNNVPMGWTIVDAT